MPPPLLSKQLFQRAAAAVVASKTPGGAPNIGTMTDVATAALEKLQSAHPEEWKLFSAMDKDNSLGLDKDELWIKLSALGDEQANQVR